MGILSPSPPFVCPTATVITEPHVRWLATIWKLDILPNVTPFDNFLWLSFQYLAASGLFANLYVPNHKAAMPLSGLCCYDLACSTRFYLRNIAHSLSLGWPIPKV